MKDQRAWKGRCSAASWMTAACSILFVSSCAATTTTRMVDTNQVFESVHSEASLLLSSSSPLVWSMEEDVQYPARLQALTRNKYDTTENEIINDADILCQQPSSSFQSGRLWYWEDILETQDEQPVALLVERSTECSAEIQLNNLFNRMDSQAIQHDVKYVIFYDPKSEVEMLPFQHPMTTGFSSSETHDHLLDDASDVYGFGSIGWNVVDVETDSDAPARQLRSPSHFPEAATSSSSSRRSKTPGVAIVHVSNSVGQALQAEIANQTDETTAQGGKEIWLYQHHTPRDKEDQLRQFWLVFMFCMGGLSCCALCLARLHTVWDNAEREYHEQQEERARQRRRRRRRRLTKQQVHEHFPVYVLSSSNELELVSNPNTIKGLIATNSNSNAADEDQSQGRAGDQENGETHGDSNNDIETASNPTEGGNEEAENETDALLSSCQCQYEPPTTLVQPASPLDQCMICLDEYESGCHIQTLPCKHAFHSKCITKWLTERSATCPLCKEEFLRPTEAEEREQEELEARERAERRRQARRQLAQTRASTPAAPASLSWFSWMSSLDGNVSANTANAQTEGGDQNAADNADGNTPSTGNAATSPDADAATSNDAGPQAQGQEEEPPSILDRQRRRMERRRRQQVRQQRHQQWRERMRNTMHGNAGAAAESQSDDNNLAEPLLAVEEEQVQQQEAE